MVNDGNPPVIVHLKPRERFTLVVIGAKAAHD
jgi:hypothetical protein